MVIEGRGVLVEGVQVGEHDLLAAAIAAGLDVVEQLGGVGAPGVPSLVQVRLELLQQTGAAAGAVIGQ